MTPDYLKFASLITCIFVITIASTILTFLSVFSNNWEAFYFEPPVGYTSQVTDGDLHALILWPDHVNVTNHRKGYILIPEIGGILTTCKMVSENLWSGLNNKCSNSLPIFNEKLFCIDYFETAPAPRKHLCCNGCPNHLIQDENVIDAGILEAMKTAISSTIVCLVLQVTIYFEIVFNFSLRKVTLTMLTGVIQLLSGIFFLFSLIINHYKLSVIMKEHYMEPLPTSVFRTLVIEMKSGTIQAWVAIGLIGFASFGWIQISYALAYYQDKMDLDLCSGIMEMNCCDISSCIVQICNESNGQTATDEVQELRHTSTNDVAKDAVVVARNLQPNSFSQGIAALTVHEF